MREPLRRQFLVVDERKTPQSAGDVVQRLTKIRPHKRSDIHPAANSGVNTSEAVQLSYGTRATGPYAQPDCKSNTEN